METAQIVTGALGFSGMGVLLYNSRKIRESRYWLLGFTGYWLCLFMAIPMIAFCVNKL